MKPLYLSLLLMFLLVSCSKKNEQEFYQEAQQAVSQKNYQLAAERYLQAVDASPQSAIAESSQYRIAMLYNNELRELENAVFAYRKFYTMFPNSKNAPTALFLSGFILNNELKRPDSARTAYESFLLKYPDHELAASARFELETLGKEPETYVKSDAAALGEKKPTQQEKAPKQ